MIIKCMKCGQLCDGVAFPSEDGLITLCPQCAAEDILGGEEIKDLKGSIDYLTDKIEEIKNE